MSTKDTPEYKESGDDRERIDAIPRQAVVLGIDDHHRAHLFTTGSTYEIWVLNAAGDACVHHVGPTERPPSEWVAFVDERCGWTVRQQVELRPGEGLLDDEELPPTRSEVINR